jgi:hypothetical protein
MPTGHTVITRSRLRARTSINRLSLRSPSSSSTRRSPNILSRVPPWQAIDSQTQTAGAPGRGIRRNCVRELGGPQDQDSPRLSSALVDNSRQLLLVLVDNSLCSHTVVINIVRGMDIRGLAMYSGSSTTIVASSMEQQPTNQRFWSSIQ